MNTSSRLGSLFLALLALAPCAAEVVVSPPDWKPAGPVALDQPLVKTFTITNNDAKQVTIISFAGARKAQIQLERTVLPPHSETTMTVSIPYHPVDDASTILKGEVMLLLDSEQDSVKVPFLMTMAALEPAEDLLPQRARYQPSAQDHPVEVHFFYDGTCGKCETFLKTVVIPCQNHFAKAPVTFELRSYRDQDVLSQLEEHKARYGVTEQASTFFFCGRHAYVGNDAIEEHLYEVIEAELKQPTKAPEIQGPVLPSPEGAPPAPAPQQDGQRRLLEEFRKYTGPAVFLGGMVDGVNPCAIAMAVFLIVMLTKFGHDRTSLLAAGGERRAGMGLLQRRCLFLICFGRRGLRGAVRKLGQAGAGGMHRHVSGNDTAFLDHQRAVADRAVDPAGGIHHQALAGGQFALEGAAHFRHVDLGLARKYAAFGDADVAAVHRGFHAAFHHQDLAIGDFGAFQLDVGADDELAALVVARVFGSLRQGFLADRLGRPGGFGRFGRVAGMARPGRVVSGIAGIAGMHEGLEHGMGLFRCWVVKLGCKTLWCGCGRNGSQGANSNTCASSENPFINSQIKSRTEEGPRQKRGQMSLNGDNVSGGFE